MFCLSPSLRPAVGRTCTKRLIRCGVLSRERGLDWDSRRSSSTSGWTQQQTNGSSHAKRDFLEARQVSLYELFDGNAFLLDVPEYQRPYAWRAKQVQELLSDLQQAFSSNQEHFLGAVVTTRSGEAAGEPYWVIDGQQRLTTLVMLLSYLRAWSATQPGLESLAERMHRMLYIPADPLNPAATARYRLQLRSSDQAFFADNFITTYLPHKYHLSMKLDSPANAASDFHEAAQQLQQQQRPAFSNGKEASNGASKAQANGTHPQGSSSSSSSSRPLENETWWRMYCAGDVLACHLAQAMEQGLNLQDFVHYVLKHSMVVLMTARDESTSFKIFSTLNGRGVDLAAIDKLKPELLQALPSGVRPQFAERWTALESSLGRPSFHALFEHFVVIEQAASAVASASSNGSSSSSNGSSSNGKHQQQGNGSEAASGSAGGFKGFVPPGSSLHNSSSSSSSSTAAAAQQQATASSSSAASSSGGGSPGALVRPDVLQHFSSHPDAEAALEQVLQYGQRLLLLRANDWSALAAEGGSGPSIAAELEEACFFVNLLGDDTWQPWVLEFFYQSDDDTKRAAFLRGAELLQLYCELKQDEAFKHNRWLSVGRQLLRRPFYSDQVLSTLALSADEAEDFIKLLDSRELAASADERLLVHLLLRADSINRKSLDWRKLKVVKVVPSNPPEGSVWRKTKLLLPALSDEEYAATASSSSSSSSTSGVFNPSTRNRSGSGGSKSRRSRTTSSSNGAGRSAEQTSAASSDEGRASSRSSSSSSSSSSATDSSSSSSSVPAGMREARYWHEITRSHWHNRLGNLLLLQPSGRESPGSSHLSADLPTKLRYYAACAADEHFPEFTGSLVNGRYSRDMFSPEECRQRHADIISRLIVVFGLQGGSSGI